MSLKDSISNSNMTPDDPSRRASAASSSEISMTDPALAAKLLPKDEKQTGKPKLKKTPSKLREGESSDRKAGLARQNVSPDSPSVNGVDTESKTSFPSGRPTDEHITCEHCKKPMEQSVYRSHVKLCFEKKKDNARKKKEAKEAKAKEAKAKEAKEAKEKSEEKEKDGDQPMEDQTSTSKIGTAPSESGAQAEGIIKSAKKSAAKATVDGPPKKSKKRKADGEGEKEPKKKKAKKDEPPKPKVPKPKGPVDVEKQCGVVLPNGGFCARSLTCKSHSMGAKRSVPGRSLPYDLLLAQYQKKNQAKQQKAAMDANAPLPDELETAGPVDSDEEKDTVMAAIARSRPRPCDQHIFVNTRQKYQYVRMKEMLGTALGGRGAPGGLFATAPAAAPGPGPGLTSSSGLASGNVVAVAVAGAVTTASAVARASADTASVAAAAAAASTTATVGESGERRQPATQASGAGPLKGPGSGGPGNASRKTSLTTGPSSATAQG